MLSMRKSPAPLLVAPSVSAKPPRSSTNDDVPGVMIKAPEEVVEPAALLLRSASVPL
jgi:hypothetical protein